MSRRDASAPWACRPEPKVPSRTPDGVGDTQHQLHRHGACPVAHWRIITPIVRRIRPQQQHSHAITSCGLGTDGTDCDGSGMRAQPATARCECAAGMCRPEPSAQPHARRSQRHTAPATPTWCLAAQSRGHSSTAMPSPAAVSARPHARRSQRHTAPAAPAMRVRHGHMQTRARCRNAITSCGLGTSGTDCDGSGMRAQPAATAASKQAR